MLFVGSKFDIMFSLSLLVKDNDEKGYYFLPGSKCIYFCSNVMAMNNGLHAVNIYGKEANVAKSTSQRNLQAPQLPKRVNQRMQIKPIDYKNVQVSYEQRKMAPLPAYPKFSTNYR